MFALAILTVAGVAAAAATAFAARRVSRRSATLAIIAAVALLVVQVTYLDDRLAVARVFPSPEAIIWTNVAVVLTGAISGLLLGSKSTASPVRRAVLATLVFALGFIQTGWPLLAPRPTLGPDRRSNGVVMQSSQASCSAAALATLLELHGIPASERELAALSLTTARGTLSLGRYRGLALKTAGTPLRPRVFTGTYDAFRSARDRTPGPTIVSVGLRADANIDPRTRAQYQTTWGWSPGQRHTVVLLRRLPNGDMEIADPALGKDRWPEQTLRDLWYGEAMWLERPER